MLVIFLFSLCCLFLKTNLHFVTIETQLEEGKKLVRDAIAAGIFNDLGSGSNVDLCVITGEGTQYLRTYEEANLKGVR